MSYRAGISFPGQHSEPRLICDGCGVERHVAGDKGPYTWFLERRAAPGWTIDKSTDHRKDYCVDCTCANDLKLAPQPRKRRKERAA